MMRVMVIGVVAAVVGLIIAAACIELPRLASRHNDPYNLAEAEAYEKQTGRSAHRIAQDNDAVRAQQTGRGPAQQAGDGDA
jgi:hypothetical protein